MVATVRRVTGVRRVGHAGTLDPFATGLLLVLLGRATRLARFVTELRKSYTGIIGLGATTDTDDRTGTPLATSDSWRELSSQAIHEAARSLVGRYEQRPPAFSAKHISGERAYRVARRGATPDLEPTTVEVFSFVLGEPRNGRVPFETSVGSGTYVRALARDLGERLGCGAHLEALRRTAIGTFRVEDAVPLEQLGAHRVALRAPLEAVGHLPRVQVDAEVRDRVTHGRPFPGTTAEHGPVAVVHDDELIAIADPSNGYFKPRVVLLG